MAYRRIHLCTGLLERDGYVLMVGNRYPNHAELLWNLPGGRQEGHETCALTVERELREETSLAVEVGDLAYVAESFDDATQTQFTAFCFAVDADGEPRLPEDDPYVRAVRWVPRADLRELLQVAVVRVPLLGYLEARTRYFGFLEAGITIAFADEPAPSADATPGDAADTAPRRRDDRG